MLKRALSRVNKTVLTRRTPLLFLPIQPLHHGSTHFTYSTDSSQTLEQHFLDEHSKLLKLVETNEPRGEQLEIVEGLMNQLESDGWFERQSTTRRAILKLTFDYTKLKEYEHLIKVDPQQLVQLCDNVLRHELDLSEYHEEHLSFITMFMTAEHWKAHASELMGQFRMATAYLTGLKKRCEILAGMDSPRKEEFEACLKDVTERYDEMMKRFEILSTKAKEVPDLAEYYPSILLELLWAFMLAQKPSQALQVATELLQMEIWRDSAVETIRSYTIFNLDRGTPREDLKELILQLSDAFPQLRLITLTKGQVLLGTGQASAAILIFEEICHSEITDDAAYVYAQLYLAHIYATVGNKTQSIQHLTLVNSSDPAVIEETGAVYLTLEQYQDAINRFEQALADAESNQKPGINLKIAFSYLKLGQFDRAKVIALTTLSTPEATNLKPMFDKVIDLATSQQIPATFQDLIQ